MLGHSPRLRRQRRAAPHARSGSDGAPDLLRTFQGRDGSEPLATRLLIEATRRSVTGGSRGTLGPLVPGPLVSIVVPLQDEESTLEALHRVGGGRHGPPQAALRVDLHRRRQSRRISRGPPIPGYAGRPRARAAAAPQLRQGGRAGDGIPRGAQRMGRDARCRSAGRSRGDSRIAREALRGPRRGQRVEAAAPRHHAPAAGVQDLQRHHPRGVWGAAARLQLRAEELQPGVRAGARGLLLWRAAPVPACDRALEGLQRDRAARQPPPPHGGPVTLRVRALPARSARPAHDRLPLALCPPADARLRQCRAAVARARWHRGHLARIRQGGARLVDRGPATADPGRRDVPGRAATDPDRPGGGDGVAPSEPRLRVTREAPSFPSAAIYPRSLPPESDPEELPVAVEREPSAFGAALAQSRSERAPQNPS